MTPRPHQSAPFLAAAASLAILATAYGFEHIGGYPPCELCWWQRYIYMLAAPLGLVGYWLQTAGRAGAMFGRFIAGTLAMVFLVGAGIAAYHTGVEQKWWAGPQGCSASQMPDSLDQMLKNLMAARIIRCDEAPWSLFGISMAGYNLILSLGLAVYCGLAAGKRRRKPT